MVLQKFVILQILYLRINKDSDVYFDPSKTKRRQLYLKPQSVPRCKHFSSGL